MQFYGSLTFEKKIYEENAKISSIKSSAIVNNNYMGGTKNAIDRMGKKRTILWQII